MSSIEGVFMIGIALAYFLFPFNSDTNPDAWLNVYWLLAAISFLYVLCLFFLLNSEGGTGCESFR
jgi:hypothetical protein